MIVTKKVEGEVDYNDGEFAEVRTIGIEGIENGLWLGTMHSHRAKIEYTNDEQRGQRISHHLNNVSPFGISRDRDMRLPFSGEHLAD